MIACLKKRMNGMTDDFSMCHVHTEKIVSSCQVKMKLNRKAQTDRSIDGTALRNVVDSDEIFARAAAKSVAAGTRRAGSRDHVTAMDHDSDVTEHDTVIFMTP
jgi:hypothetical protein